MNPRVLMAGLMGLLGGVKGGGIGAETPRPSVDDIWGNTKKKVKVKILPRIRRAQQLRKHRWQIAKASRKKNYLKNGTRG